MPKFVSKWLNVYEDEMGLFLWCALLIFLIRSSNILFINFAETAFLKRFGVEYLPLVYIINSIATFFIMGLLTGIMGRLSGARLLTYMLVFCGGSVAALRFVTPLGIDLLYPVLYILRMQYEVMLGLFFWNLANDLFNMRQSKRLFPLITAGGVLGGILASFGTPFLAKAVRFDNLMFVYLVTSLLGALTVKGMGARYPTLLLTEKGSKHVKSRPSILEEFKRVIPLVRESLLVKILIALTLLPNVVGPILNYQFNVAIDQYYGTETGLIAFFGYFRGALNIISLGILLFVGRIYGRWGLPTALLFHPFNYLGAFMAFLFRFDIFSAIYANISTTVLRNTINAPARAILVGLVPESYRALARPFLRGTVVRVGVLLGSAAIMVTEGFLHPRYLSIVAGVFVTLWIGTGFFLKRRYSGILLDLISRNMLDLKSMEETDVSHVFTDKQIQSQLVQALSSARGDDCLWYADLLRSLQVEDLDTHILSILKKQDDKTRTRLLSLLSPNAGKEAIAVFEELRDPDKPDLMVAMVEAANRLPPEAYSAFCREIFETTPHPEVKAHAVVGLYGQSPQIYHETISSWLESEDVAWRKAGVIAAGGSGDGSYVPRLKALLEGGQDDAVLPLVIKGLKRLGAEDINSLVSPYLSHPVEWVRRSALEVFDITDDESLRVVIGHLDDPSEGMHQLAKDKLEAAPYQNAQVLVESLAVPRRRVREGIFALLEALDIKDIDVFRFGRSQVEKGYRCLAQAEALRRLPEGQERDLLIDHLEQRKDLLMENTLRVLVTQDTRGEMRLIWRGLSSSDSRQRSNSLELLDDRLDVSLSRIMIPLLEKIPPSQVLDVGRKNFQLPRFDSRPDALYAHLVAEPDGVTVILALYLMANQGLKDLKPEVIRELAHSDNAHVREMAQHVIRLYSKGTVIEEEEMTNSITIPDKILHLKGIHIFNGLSVSELAAIASVTEEEVFPAGETVIREGDPGETMYMIIKGEVAVLKDQGGGAEIELDRIGTGDYFGEMALFEGDVRSATNRTCEESRLLVLHKREFTEIVREYPQIALSICKGFGDRLRKLHEKLRDYEK